MTNNQPWRRPGRRPGESRTRQAILGAARQRFGEHGYDGATIRGIAREAGVDPALVHHFYGTKERLFAAAMSLPVVPSEIITSVLGAERDRLGAEFLPRIGEILVRSMLGAWDVADIRTAFIGLLRSAATTDQGVTMLREFVTSTILASLSQVAGLDDDAEGRFRATLVASQVVGLGFARYVLGLEPLASAATEDLVAAIGPTMQRYLTGNLGALPDPGPDVMSSPRRRAARPGRLSLAWPVLAATMKVYVVIPDNDRQKSVSQITVRTTPVSDVALVGPKRDCAMLPADLALRPRGRSPGGTRNTRTIRQAIQELVSESRLVVLHGRGTWVLTPPDA